LGLLNPFEGDTLKQILIIKAQEKRNPGEISRLKEKLERFRKHMEQMEREELELLQQEVTDSATLQYLEKLKNLDKQLKGLKAPSIRKGGTRQRQRRKTRRHRKQNTYRRRR